MNGHGDDPPYLIAVSTGEDGRLTGDDARKLPGDVVERYHARRAASYIGKRMRLVRFDSQVFERALAGIAGNPLRVRLFSDLDAYVRGEREQSADESVRGYVGSSVGRGPERVAANSVSVLAWTPGRPWLAASFEGPGTHVRIEPVGSDLHVVYDVVPGRLPPDHGTAPGAVDGRIVQQAQPPQASVYTPGHMTSARTAQSDRDVVLTVAFAFTDQAADLLEATAPGAGKLLMALRVWCRVFETNAYFANSGVRLRIRAGRIERAGIGEGVAPLKAPVQVASPWNWMQLALLDPRVIESLNLHCWWGQSGCSALVVVGEFGGDPTQAEPNVGFGGVTRKPSGVWTPEGLDTIYDESVHGYPVGAVAYAVVKRVNMDNHLTLAHEIGHMLGADHERKHRGIPLLILDPGRPIADKSYGHLLTNAGERAVSIMYVGDTAQERDNRVGIYSTEGNVNNPPVPQPPASWGSATSNNVEIMNRLADRLARHRPPACP